MAEYEQYLATLDFDPTDEAALAALESLANNELSTPEAAEALDNARKTLKERGELEVVAPGGPVGPHRPPPGPAVVSPRALVLPKK